MAELCGPGRHGIGAVAAAVLLAGQAFCEPFDYEKEYIACVQQRAYDAGGALVGDCFNAQIGALDAEMAARMNRAAKNFCSDGARAGIAAAQSAWVSYRETYCDLLEASPGNTPSWIAGGACRLDLTRKRLDALKPLEGAHMWCLTMAFVPAISHFGDPAGVSRSSDDPAFAWEGPGDAARAALRITGASGESLSLDTTGCRYCETGAGCDDGVFAIQDRTAVFQSGTGSGFGKTDLFHVCHSQEGARLDIIGNLAGRPALAESFTGAHSIAWAIDEGRLRIVVDGDAAHPRHWPARAGKSD